ncbi:MAG TPA: DUF2334 domain-containing protein [Thermoanaerobaculia bacterium]
MNWPPASKRAAVCFSIDDVHPAPVAAEALGHVRWLQPRHPQLRVTLFTTPDWRTIDLYPTRKLISRIPVVRDRVFTVAVHPRGKFRLDRHEEFCAALRTWSSAEIALHGLHHVARGMRPALEFGERSTAECSAMLSKAMRIFADAGLPLLPGMAAPGWSAPPPLLAAACAAGFKFIVSARDLATPAAAGATANGSGMTGIPLFRPHALASGLIHLPVNFQATSSVERALSILQCGGLLSIKAHLLAESGTYRALDGLTRTYRDYLDGIFCSIEDRFGDEVWWTSMGEITQ